DIADNPNAMLTQQLFGDSTRRNPAHGLAGAGSAAAAVVAEAVFGIECEVGVPRPVLVLDLAVICTALIGVAEENANRRTVGLALEDAGPDFWDVLFLALRDELRLARPAAAQVGQQVCFTKRQAGGAAVDDADVAWTMTDARRGDAEQLAEGIA